MIGTWGKKQRYVLVHENIDTMDVLLRGMMASMYEDQIKLDFGKMVADAASKAQNSQEVRNVLELATKLILEGEKPVDIKVGYLVYNKWAEAASPTTLESFFTRVHLVELLESQYLNIAQVPCLISLTFRLMQRGPHLTRLLGTVRAKAINFVKTHRGLDCMMQFLELLQQQPDVVPVGDLPCLCQELLLWMGRLESPSKAEDCLEFLVSVNHVARGMQCLWLKSDAALALSLQTIFGFLLQEGSAPSFSLAAAVAHIPTEYVESNMANMAEAAVTSNRINDTNMKHALERLVDWLSWPTPTPNLALWIRTFFSCLAQAKRTAVLVAVSESRALEVLGRLKMRSARKWSLMVLSTMMIGYQHSPKLFHQILGKLHYVWKDLQLPADKESLDDLADLLHTLMHIHPGYPELYAPFQDLIKDYRKPSEEEMQAKQEGNHWALGAGTGMGLQLAGLPSRGEGEPQPMQLARKGLLNSGASCYANCIIQNLLSNDRFRQLLMYGNLRGKVADLMREVFSFLIASERPTVSLDGFREHFKERFAMKTHEDCQEYLLYLLNRLNDEDKAMHHKEQQQLPGPPPDGGSAGDSAPTESPEEMTELEKVFWIEMREDKECQSCHHRTSHPMSYTDLGLSLVGGEASSQCSLQGGQEGPGPQPMQEESGGGGEPGPQASHAPPPPCSQRGELRDLVKRLFEEHLCDAKCPNCGEQDVLSHQYITRPPDSLTVTLLRFVFNRTAKATLKKFDKVNIQQYLLLPVESGVTSTDPQDPHAQVLERLRAPDENGTCHEVYGLTGVVVHKGLETQSGHYYTNVRHAVRRTDCCLGEGKYDFYKDDWIHFDDENVSPTTGSRVMQGPGELTNETPYLLLYTRVGSELLKDCDASSMVPISQLDPPLKAELLEAVTRDNAIHQQELREAAVRRQKRKEEQPPPGYPWKDSDSDQGPPGNCGGGQGFGGFNSGPRFVF